MQMFTVAATTNGSGAFSTTLSGASGCFLQMVYVPHGSTPIDTNADIDLVGATTGLVLIAHDNIGTSTFTRCYRQATHATDGSASLYAAAGEPVEDYIFVHGEDLTFTVANGASTKSGTFYLWFG